ncbi:MULTISPECIES: hypothetical protein [Bacillus cereus group]|uniref:DUF2187 domain-containing protein n=1 Tax=Bacillus cytotoxicus (strain DSM 22905 / CIP 110041 / 391-98 / NVH 391-98) TaxID=315749 RepID=A7GUQ9_BACCN|nr:MULTISPECIES: hypothetical protein [Bacillus cereus group]ABS23867.1 hypothetical protein Bcer98_3670 [Bacillus cytotoxicus NVH 391-98]AWC46469.1 DUF2187 domain-containing protein [Bacillus cytotoxicus]MDH2865193.1 DUF2187 domain-containing protein [Bacillus cytotoxicus]MDH2884986.1 DUF2187 domain-containing protein [Bacillus cytotoxicus]MDH2888568.1 DUF2187 domain-containing protein [Bacillus cytotoxicus]
MEHKTKITIGDYVQFSYRKNPNLQLTGYVVSVLQNTIVVDDVRQVVKHGCYNKVIHKLIKNNVS